MADTNTAKATHKFLQATTSSKIYLASYYPKWILSSSDLIKKDERLY